MLYADDADVHAAHHFLSQGALVAGLERVLQRRQLVEQATQRPYVRFLVVRTAAPPLATCNTACQSVYDAAFGDLGHTQVAYFDLSGCDQENVLSLDVTVQDIGVVQTLQTLANLDEETQIMSSFMGLCRAACRLTLAPMSPPRASSV